MSFATLAISGIAQQSIGGYGQGGQGGQGGGVGGPGGGRAFKGRIVYGNTMDQLQAGTEAAPERRARPEDDTTAGLWTTRTAILTPGDQFTYKLKIEKGETLFAGASSDAFDPALAIEDSHKKVLAKNDDRVDGDQSPFLIYHFKEAGEYTLKVLSYRSVAGGKFVLKLRTFLATDIAVGTAEHAEVQPIQMVQNRIAFRLAAVKGKIYDIREVLQRVTFPNGFKVWNGTNLVGVVGPTGVAESDFIKVDSPDSGPVIQALANGDYYVEYTLNQPYGPDAKVFKSDVREVMTVAVKAMDQQTISFGPNELKLIELPVKKDEIVRTTVSGDPFATQMSSFYSKEGTSGPGQTEREDDAPYGNAGAWFWFRTNIDSSKQIVRVFQGSGTIRFAVRSQTPNPVKLTLENSESLPEWKDGVPLNNALNIGDSQLFLIKSTKSELMRVNAQAAHFLPRLDIFRLTGELANTLCDRRTHIAKDDLYFPDEGTFIVRLSCEGNGGSGDFAMNRETMKTTPYTLDAAQTVELNGQNFGLYSVDLQAGKRYQLVLDNPNNPIQVDLLDDDGQFLTSQSLRFDNVLVHYFVPTKSGRHRLWLRGGPGVRHFQLDIHTAPSIGGVVSGASNITPVMCFYH